MMKKIGIIVAMSVEYRLVEALLEDKSTKKVDGFCFVEGRIGHKNIVLTQSGIGKVCAAVGVTEMIRHSRPDCIINTGVAGGIDEKLRVMDIVVGENMVYHDVWCGEGNAYGQIQGLPAVFRSDEDLLESVVSVQGPVKIVKGLICSGDKFITDRMALKAIKGQFPDGLAVDMESAAMAQVCYMLGVPFLSMRIISDTPGNTEDHSAQYRDFWTAAPETSFEVLKQLMFQI